MIYANDCRGDIIVINGKTKPKENLPHSIMDTGTSIYEVLKVKEKTLLFFEEHIDRLFYSSNKSGVRFIPSREFLGEAFNLVIKNNPEIQEGNIRLILHYPDNILIKPDVYCYYIPHYYPSKKEYYEGVPVILVNSVRKNVHSKIINIKFRSAIMQKINNKNAYEALLVNREGFITEGSKSNIFMISKNIIITPPEQDVLPGITRNYILRICNDYGIEIREKKIHCKEINKYESCFLTGTSSGMLPVKNIGSVFFNRKNKLLEKISRKYQSLVNDYISVNKSKFNTN